MLVMNARNVEHLELLGLLAKEGWQKAHLGDYHSQKQALSRFTLGALVVSPPILDVLRRELRRLSPEVRIDTDEIKAALEADVIKREVLEGDKAEAAKRHISRAAGRTLRAIRSMPNAEDAGAPVAVEPSGSSD